VSAVDPGQTANDLIAHLGTQTVTEGIDAILTASSAQTIPGHTSIATISATRPSEAPLINRSRPAPGKVSSNWPTPAEMSPPVDRHA
jgi:hypothetical protein